MTAPAGVVVFHQMTQLTKYKAARQALQEAVRVDEVKDIRDKAQAMAAYAKQAKDTALVEWATEIKVRAERRAGQLLAEMKIKPGRPEKSSHDTRISDIGISYDQSSRWQKLAAVPESQFEQAVAAAKEVAGEVTTAAMLRQGEERVKRKRTPGWKPDPLFASISATLVLARANSPARVIADLKRQYDGGNGFDQEFQDELVYLKTWLDEVITGVEPFIVSCAV